MNWLAWLGLYLTPSVLLVLARLYATRGRR